MTFIELLDQLTKNGFDGLYSDEFHSISNPANREHSPEDTWSFMVESTFSGEFVWLQPPSLEGLDTPNEDDGEETGLIRYLKGCEEDADVGPDVILHLIMHNNTITHVSDKFAYPRPADFSDDNGEVLLINNKF